MVHKFALLVGGVGAAAVLALALALGGFIPASSVAADGGIGGANMQSAEPTVFADPTPTATDDASRKLVDTVYVMPTGDDSSRGASGDDDRNDPDRSPTAADDDGDHDDRDDDDHDDDGQYEDGGDRDGGHDDGEWDDD